MSIKTITEKQKKKNKQSCNRITNISPLWALHVSICYRFVNKQAGVHKNMSFWKVQKKASLLGLYKQSMLKESTLCVYTIYGKRWSIQNLVVTFFYNQQSITTRDQFTSAVFLPKVI